MYRLCKDKMVNQSTSFLVPLFDVEGCTVPQKKCTNVLYVVDLHLCALSLATTLLISIRLYYITFTSTVHSCRFSEVYVKMQLANIRDVCTRILRINAFSYSFQTKYSSVSDWLRFAGINLPNHKQYLYE